MILQERLKSLFENLDILMSQHALYISKLEKAIKSGKSFNHKTCHECNFGVIWDNHVVPIKGELPEEIKSVVEEIEKIHCEFHEVSMQIDPLNSHQSYQEKLIKMKDLSAVLFQKLLYLRRLVKEE